MTNTIGYINSFNKKNKYLDLCLFIVLYLISIASIAILFYRQATTSSDLWVSDIISYMEEITGTNSTYAYPYPIMFIAGKIFNAIIGSAPVAITLTGIFFITLSMIITKFVLYKQTQVYYLSTLISFGLHFISMIYSPVFTKLGILTRNTGVFTPNPWYNLTYMAARPFMILAFVLGWWTLANYEVDLKKGSLKDNANIKYYILFALSMLLVTMTKPSYTIVHMGAAGLVMLYRLFINKGKNFVQTFLLGICYIPTIIDLLYQYLLEFTGGALVGTEQGIGIDLFVVWKHFTNNIPLAIVLAGAYPLFTLLVHLQDIKHDDQFRFSWQIYLIGLGMAAIFYEKGYTMYHCNFFWGYECGLFLVFLSSTVKTIRDSFGILKNSKGLSLKGFVLLLQWLLFILHVGMGVYYFYILTALGANPA